MATRDNQTLQIFLMIFGLLVVLLGVTTYVGLKQASDRANEIVTLKDAAQSTGQALSQAQDEVNDYKEMIGFSIEETLPAIQEAYTADMSTGEPAIPEDTRSYRPVVQYLREQLQVVTARESAATQSAQELSRQLEELQANTAAQIDTFKKEIAKIAADAGAEREKFNSDRATFKKQLDAEIQKGQQQFEKLTAQIGTLTQQNDKLAKDAGTERQKNIKLNEEIGSLTSESFEVPDGNVTLVNQVTERVWLNRGRADGLREQVIFSIYGRDEPDAVAAKKKGTVQVIRLIGEKTAEARITSQELSDSIQPGDHFYSPVWHPGRPERFALAGAIDIDGDGRSDRDRVRDLIRINGGVIDAELLESGEVRGKMTFDTKFLVQGKIAAAKVGGQGTSAGVHANYSKMHSEALTLGVEPISVAEFLDLMGWQPGENTVRLGRSRLSSQDASSQEKTDAAAAEPE